MSTTTYARTDALTSESWSKMLAHEVSKATPIAPLIGKGQNKIIQLKTETQKNKGDKVTFGLRTQLVGDGVTEGTTLEGNEESLTTYSESLVINELNHAVRVAADDTISAQRVLFNMREEAVMGLKDWYADRISLMFFLQVGGYTPTSITFEGRTVSLSAVHWGNNAPNAATSDRILRKGGAANDQSITSADVFTLDLIDKAKEKARVANPRIRPIRVDGEEVYVMYLHPYQVTDLRTITSDGQWLDIMKAAYQGSRAKNPIFDGSLGMYNGVVLRESEHVTTGVDESDTSEESDVRRAVFLGAQAAVMAFGQNKGPTKYKMKEESFDYGREMGVAAKTILGMKKTQFSTNSGSDSDFGSIVVSTYAAAHTS